MSCLSNASASKDVFDCAAELSHSFSDVRNHRHLVFDDVNNALCT